MSKWSSISWLQWYRRASAILAAAVIVGGLLVLLGWALDVQALKGVVVGLATMKPNTAFALVLGGLAALLGLKAPVDGRCRLGSTVAASGMLLIGGATLLEYLLHKSFGIDQLLFRDPTPATGMSFPGRPAPATALLFVLLSSACLLARFRMYAWVSQVLTIVSCVITYLILAGYIYGATSLYSVGFFSSVALHTAILGMSLSLAVMGLTADVGVMGLICSEAADGVMARRLLPIVFVLPVSLGWLRRQGQTYGLYEQEFGSAIFVTSNVLIFSTVTLLTARALARHDAARRAAERRFELAIEAAPNAMLLTNARGNIVFINSHVERLFGRRNADLVGQPFDLLLAERHRKGKQTIQIGHGDAESLAARSRDPYGRRADGSEFPIEMSLSPIESQGEPLKLIAILDVTARTRLEEERREHLAELAHASRLSTVGQMMSELAHELNQPLAAAANYARACVNIRKAGGPGAVDEIADCMEKAVAQTSRAIDIVKRIGAFAKKDVGAWTPVNLNRLVENVVTLTIPTMKGSRTALPVTPRTDLDESAPEVHVDRVQIEQVLVNLIRNAVEAMQSPSCLDRSLIISTRRRDRDVQISVRDHGGGIAAADMARLFTPYFTTKSDGMGLGLSISRTIVEQHHGQLTVNSTRDGAEFKFTLPIPESPGVAIQPRRATMPL